MKNIHFLQPLGFSEVEEHIYLVLLEKGSCSIAELAQALGKHRPRIYSSLPKLMSSGLVASFKQGKRLKYRIESPLAILSLLKERDASIKTLIPTLMETFDARNKGLKTSYYVGERGIKNAYEYLLRDTKRKGTLYRYESPRDYVKNKKFYPAIYAKRGSRTGDLEKYVITNEITENTRRESLNRSTRAVPAIENEFIYNITQIISDKKILIVDYDGLDATIIENDRFVAFQKAIFETLFKRLKKTRRIE